MGVLLEDTPKKHLKRIISACWIDQPHVWATPKAIAAGGDKWLVTHAVYKDQVAGDRRLQGYYTKENALVWGYYCK